jgi:hypothetical protein
MYMMTRTIKSKAITAFGAIALICTAPVFAASGNILPGLGQNPGPSSALKLHDELFVKPNLSVGEASLVTKDPIETWRAAQTRLWVDLPYADAQASTKLFVQSGLGFLERDPLLQLQSSLVPSVVIPLGVGMQYALRSKHSLTTMFSLDISEGRFGPAAAPHIAPGLSFGLRF